MSRGAFCKKRRPAETGRTALLSAPPRSQENTWDDAADATRAVPGGGAPGGTMTPEVNKPDACKLGTRFFMCPTSIPPLLLTRSTKTEFNPLSNGPKNGTEA